jgi:hypothetical protein
LNPDDCHRAPQRAFEYKRVMATVLWSLAGFHVIDLLPEGVAMSTEHLIENVLPQRARLLCPDGVRPSKGKIWLPLDDSRARRSRPEMAEAGSFGFKRPSHLLYSLETVQSDIFLCGEVEKHLEKGSRVCP